MLESIDNVKKMGNSHYILIPKEFVNFYNWNENTMIQLQADSKNLIISKLSQIDDEFKKRAGIPSEVKDDKDGAVEKSN